MGLSFNDLDYDLQRSVFAATTIVFVLLGLSFVRIVHFILFGVVGFLSFYLAFKLFLSPLIQKSKEKKKLQEK